MYVYLNVCLCMCVHVHLNVCVCCVCACVCIICVHAVSDWLRSKRCLQPREFSACVYLDHLLVFRDATKPESRRMSLCSSPSVLAFSSTTHTQLFTSPWFLPPERTA